MDYQIINRFLEGKTTPEETALVLAAIAANPELEEYYITQRRLEYTNEQLQDYDSFIPASSMAADDGRNLCDLQCEAFILKKEGLEASQKDLSVESRKNYWLRSQGTPLFNVGKLLESKGFLVNRVYDATMDILKEELKEHSIIVVVNGDTLSGKQADILSEDFSLDSAPNHAVVVLDVNEERNSVTLYNPATEEESTEYSLDVFLDAWGESSNYLVTVRKKADPFEYCPQPIEVSDIELNPELVELVELLCENAHDDWAVGKIAKAKADGKVLSYGPVDGDDRDSNMRYSHYFVPYSMLSEDDKTPDRVMVVNTIKRLKRLGYRLVNINSMYRCPDCGEVIEPSNNYCPCCGRCLTWEDFKDA